MNYKLKKSRFPLALLAVMTFCIMALSPVTASAQGSGAGATVKGTVVDRSGSPLPGVALLVRGTSYGVATNADGTFTINLNTAGNQTVDISCLGMKSISMPASSFRNGMTIRMSEDTNTLNDVVVTGYANIRKESFTGTSTVVSRDELLKASPQNAIKGLAAFDPSFKLVTDNINGSNPNAMSDLYIRGRSGISEITELDQATGDVSEYALKNNQSAPVFILDGFEVSQETIYDLDINRIESMTILKDAAATAVYGSRAANGVIVVETVTPEAGRVNVSYSGNISITAPDLNSYTLMNAQECLEAEKYAGLFEGTSVFADAAGLVNYERLYNNVRRGVNTDWIAKPLRNVVNHKHYVSIGGGTHDLRWQADVNYQNKDGVMKDSYRNIYGTSMTLDYRHGNFQIKNKMTVNIMNSEESPYGAFSDYVRMKPYLSPYDEQTGNLVKLYTIYRNVRQSTGSIPVYVKNPLYEATTGNFDSNGYKEFVDNLGLNWNITPYLLAKGTFSVSYKVTDDDTFVDPLSGTYLNQKDATLRGSYRDGDLRYMSWNANGFLSYNRTLNSHNINATLGFEAAETKSSSMYANYIGFVDGAKAAPSNALQLLDKPSFGDNNTRRAGTYLQGNYTYRDIYLFDISGRYEGSSVFGARKKMGAFWSTGAGINVHNYEALKQAGWIDRLKVKATYGVTGKSNFSPYQARDTYQILYDNPYVDVWGMQLKALGNENLMWERVNKLNLGTEIQLFDNLLAINFDWYNEITRDQVEDLSIPASSGFTSYKANVGEVTNRGFDLRANVRVFSTSDAEIRLFANVNHNINRISKLGEAMQAYNDRIDDFYAGYSSITATGAFADGQFDPYTVPFTKYEVGNSLSAIYGMKSLGIDPATGNELYVKRDGSTTYTWSSAEQQCLGDYDPKLSGNFGINARYRKWTLYSSLAFRLGGQAYNSTLSSIENVNLEKYSGDVRILTDRWKEVGDVSKLKSMKDRTNVTRPTSRFVQDDNTLTCGSVSIGYTLDRNIVKKIGFSTMRFQLNVEDLFYLSSIRRERGTSYPYARTANLGIVATL